ncbi:hypothetical protein pb186bvf_010352 [Paramecium bursaria]
MSISTSHIQALQLLAIASKTGQRIQLSKEILVYSSNQTTPLRTAGIQQQNQFLFEDNKLLTPQPTQNRNFDFTQKKELLFIFSRPGLLNNLNAKIWYYIDDFSKIQGPFSTIQMENWYQKGIFDEIRRVGNLVDQTEFYPRIHQLKGPIKKEDKIIIKSLLRIQSCPKKIDNYENKVVLEKQYAEVPNIRIPQPKKKEMKK